MSQQGTKNELLPGVNIARILPPQVPPHITLREELMEQLETAIPFAIFVVAPSGYGKTSLVSQWASKYPKNTIWYTVAKSDTPRDSLYHFIESFRRIFPDFAPWAESTIKDELNTADVVTRMANDIYSLGTQINFITDSAENLSNDHREMMELWTANAPTNLRTVTTRTSVPAPIYARAAGLNAIKVINASDLRLGESDIQALADYYEVDLQENENRRSVDLAQGWPTGVNIALKAIRDGRNIVKGTSYEDIKLMDSRTLVRSAINSLNDYEQSFLKNLSTFEEVRPEFVRDMLQDSSARNSLRRMSAEGVFISEVGTDQSSFQINPIIRDVILEDLRRDEEKYRAICKKSAEVLLSHDHPLWAIELYMEAGEIARATEIINANTRKMIYTNSGEILRRWRKVVAESLQLEFTGEAVVDAYNAMVSSSLDVFKSKLSELNLMAKVTPDEKKISGDVAVMSIRILFSEGELSACIRLALTLKDLEYTQSDFAAAKILTGLRFAAWSANLLEDYESLLKIQEVAENLSYPRDQLPLIGISAIQSIVALADGRLKDARDLALYTLNTSNEHGYDGIVSPFEATYVLAEVSREYVQLDLALEYSTRLIEMAKKHELYPWTAALMAKSALIYSNMGESATALKILREAREYLSHPHLGHEIHRIVDEHELFIRIAVRDTERLEELLYRMPKTTTIQAFSSGLLMGRNPSSNSQALSALPTRTLREKLNFEILAAMSVMDKPADARKHIHNAIHLAMSQGHRRIFLAQMESFKNLILDYASEHPSVYVEQLAIAIRESLKAGSSAQGVGMENPLTKRELDILRRLTTGLPITQIAASLHISNNTIKTHLKNVYKKLGVDSRESAVIKGKELLLF